jgi:hypothetical protein
VRLGDFLIGWRRLGLPPPQHRKRKFSYEIQSYAINDQKFGMSVLTKPRIEKVNHHNIWT